MSTIDPTSPVWGLTSQEAEESRQKYGSNALSEQPGESYWDKLRGSFDDPMIKILLAALLVNVIFSIMGASPWYEPLGIALAIALATMVSSFSEYKNENAFQRLQEEASQIKSKVYRDGSVGEIPISELVVGDCVVLQSGDKIPADGILLEGTLKVEQSALNGEAKEATKRVQPADYQEQNTALDFLNPYKLFRGSVVCSGSAVMQVSVVGDKSVYGQIASELQSDDGRDSPLKVKLSGLAAGISRFGYIGGVGIAVALLFQRIVVHNNFESAAIMQYCSNWMTLAQDVMHALMLAVVIIVMAVPEGLPLMIAIVSALNMGKMLRDHVLVRKITGIETAGSLNILFTDKTGTLTKGQLEAVVFIDGQGGRASNFKEIPQGLQTLAALSFTRNTEALLNTVKGVTSAIGGNATERALLNFSYENLPLAEHAKSARKLAFNSTNKYSAEELILENDRHFTFIKGAPERLLNYCRFFYDAQGKRQPIASKEALVKIIDEMAERAIRVLAFAVVEEPLGEEKLPEGEWTLLGFVGIRDEIRQESAQAIAEVKSAGVQTVMITGDRRETATAIATEIGLIDGPVSEQVMTSDELAKLDDAKLAEILPNLRVVARALPSDKSRLVKAAQNLNLVAGMTGDGVNDSPALKHSDVGFAMGSGTEVAKEASEIVILNDNFLSIRNAILYGRTIFNSIRKFIVFQLTINVAAVLISFIAPLIGIEQPLTITQILWINLVMDTLAALAFGGEPPREAFMQVPPKRRDENIVSPYMWDTIAVGGAWTFALSLFFLMSPWVEAYFRPHPEGNFLRTGFFTFFVLISVFNAFNTRTDGFNLFDSLSKNLNFLWVMLTIVVVQCIMTYLGGPVLHCYGLNAHEWLLIGGMAFSIVIVDLLKKVMLKFRHVEAF